MGVIGFLIIVLAWIGGVGFGLFALINWGIFQIIDAASVEPTDFHMLGWGIAWIFLSSICGSTITWIGLLVGGSIMVASED